MTPADLSRTVLGAVRRAVEEGALRVAAVPERVRIERPRPGGRGDWATSAALQLAGPAALPAGKVAEILREQLSGTPGIARVEITGPGFLNFTLRQDSRAALVRTVLAAGETYGHGDGLAGTRVRFAPVAGIRGDVWVRTVVALLRTQGATADIGDHGGERIAPVPAPEGIERLGADASRWALLRAAAHDRPYADRELLVQGESNPLFRVRYAYSRTRALTRGAARLGFTGAYEDDVDAPALFTALGDHPAVLEAAARHRAPDRVARHLESTADALLGFQHTVLPRGDEKPSAAHRSRLALAEAAGTVLAGGLALLGISAPEHL
ncbi:ArgS-related anticodon-binding protein NrtL [Streptomyces sp. NPDC000410]|uniref:ArgS-related anticodon-binding protein NrtL n=1 Tax=Streptomyces sp. NPDC000410 TaxID=3154254 RepID=UPI003332F5BA